MFGITPARTELILAIVIIFLGLLMLLNHWRGSWQPPRSDSQPGIDIKDLIVSVKSALGKIEQENVAKNEAPLFEVKDFDLELNFIVRKDQKGTGGFEAKVVTLGAEEQYGSETIQKIKLHLTTLPIQQESGRPSKNEISQPGKANVIGDVPQTKQTP